MVYKECPNCKKFAEKHAKGLCITCYKKLYWKPKLHICKRCNRTLPNHAQGLCAGCYQSTFQLDKIKNFNYKKYHNIEPELYRKLTKQCLICNFDKVVELHHLDKNRINNSENNLVGLCPNHHKMLHNLKYKEEISRQIKEKMS